MESRFRLMVMGTLLLLDASTVHSQQFLSLQTPQFVLVHGWGHGAWCWYKVVALLQRRGFKATAIDLASAGRDKAIADDIESIAQSVKPLTNFLDSTHDQIIMVGHSLGGVAVSHVLEHYPSRIIKAVFVTALMPSNNETASQIVPSTVFANLIATSVLTLYAANASDPSRITSMAIGSNTAGLVNVFYNKSPPEDIVLGLSMLESTPWEPSFEPLVLTNAGYGSVRRFYIRTGFDNTLLPEVQEEMINNNPPERVFVLDGSDHSPFFSAPIQLTHLLICISRL